MISNIPLICNFWESMLFGSGEYKGNAMLKHIELNQLASMLPIHFERWLFLWEGTLDTLFSGPKADWALHQAKSIAGLMEYEVQSNMK